ncbi:MAG: hypothetical protein ACTSUR_01790 [Candidatus Heimdallarchaeaceae archaeon]
MNLKFGDILRSVTGILSFLFWAAGGAGCVLLALYEWLPEYQSSSDILTLIITIALFAGAAFFVLALFVSFSQIPKFLYVLFTLLSLACAVFPGVVLFIKNGTMPYLDFSITNAYWFWLAIGGSFLGFFFSIFTRKD